MKIFEQEAPDTKITEVVCNDDQLCYQPPFESFIVIPENTEELKQIRETAKQLLSPDSGEVRWEPDNLTKQQLQNTKIRCASQDELLTVKKSAFSQIYEMVNFLHPTGISAKECIDIIKIMDTQFALAPKNFNSRKQLDKIKKKAIELTSAYGDTTFAHCLAVDILELLSDNSPPEEFEWLMIRKSDYEVLKKSVGRWHNGDYTTSKLQANNRDIEQIVNNCFHKPGGI